MENRLSGSVFCRRRFRAGAFIFAPEDGEEHPVPAGRRHEVHLTRPAKRRLRPEGGKEACGCMRARPALRHSSTGILKAMQRRKIRMTRRKRYCSLPVHAWSPVCFFFGRPRVSAMRADVAPMRKRIRQTHPQYGEKERYCGKSQIVFRRIIREKKKISFVNRRQELFFAKKWAILKYGK